MNRLLFWLTRLTFGVSLGVIFMLTLACDSGKPGQRVGDVAPDISGDTPEGKLIRVSDYQGKVVLVDFWGTWCGPCKMLVPLERRMVNETYRNRPFVLIGIAQDDPETLRRYQEIAKLPWQNIADPNSRISRQWDFNVVPCFVLIDHTGVIRGKWMGGNDWEAIKEAVEECVQAAEKK